MNRTTAGVLALFLIVALAASAVALVKVEHDNLDHASRNPRLSPTSTPFGGAR